MREDGKFLSSPCAVVGRTGCLQSSSRLRSSSTGGTENKNVGPSDGNTAKSKFLHVGRREMRARIDNLQQLSQDSEVIIKGKKESLE